MFISSKTIFISCFLIFFCFRIIFLKQLSKLMHFSLKLRHNYFYFIKRCLDTRTDLVKENIFKLQQVA